MGKSAFELRIIDARPCTESWQLMAGDARQRHCAHCAKAVHNFAAMSDREVEELLAEKNGRLCARIVRDRNGSMLTADEARRYPLAAGFLLAASLATSTACAAQTGANPGQPGPARLTGSVIRPDKEGPWTGVSVFLISGGSVVETVKTDSNGSFDITVKPGTYDVVVFANPFVKMTVPDATLREGLQVLGPVELTPHQTEYQTVTMGVVEAIVHYPFRYFFRHPLNYLRHLPHNFS